MSNSGGKSYSPVTGKSSKHQMAVGDLPNVFNVDQTKKLASKSATGFTSFYKTSQSKASSFNQQSKVVSSKKTSFHSKHADHDRTEFVYRYGQVRQDMLLPVDKSATPDKTDQTFGLDEEHDLNKKVKDFGEYYQFLADPIDQQDSNIMPLSSTQYLHELPFQNDSLYKVNDFMVGHQFYLLTSEQLLSDQSGEQEDDSIGLLVLTDLMQKRMNFLRLYKSKGFLGVRTSLAKLASLGFGTISHLGLLQPMPIDRMEKPENKAIHFVVFDRKVFAELTHKRNQVPFPFECNVSTVSGLEIDEASSGMLNYFDVIEIFQL